MNKSVNPTLSIIIPHYNGEDKLVRLLRSIPDALGIQVIVIDDKSDIPLNGKLINHFVHSEFLLLENRTTKKGAGTSRNIGIDHCESDWLLFADADDFFLPDMHASVCYEIEAASPSTDVIYFPPTSIYENSGQPANRHQSYARLTHNHQQEESEKIRYKFYSPCSKIIRTNLIKKKRIRFDEIPVSNDVMFSTYAGHLADKVAVSAATIYCIIKSGSSLTAKKDKASRDIRLDTTLRYNRLLCSIQRVQYQMPLSTILFEYRKTIDLKKSVAVIHEAVSNGWKLLKYRHH